MLIKPAHDPARVTVVESSLVSEFLLPEVSLWLNKKVPRDAGAFGRERGRWSTAAKKLVWLTFDDDAQPWRLDMGVPGEVEPRDTGAIADLHPDIPHEQGRHNRHGVLPKLPGVLSCLHHR